MSRNIFDDDEDEVIEDEVIEEAPSVLGDIPPAPEASYVSPTTSSEPPVPSESNSIEVTFGTGTAITTAPTVAPGAFTKVSFGTKVERYAIPRIKFSEDKKELILLFSDDVTCVKLHFLGGEDDTLSSGVKGFFYSTPLLEKTYGPPAIRYVVPFIRLKTNDEGKPISPPAGDVMIMQIGEESYDSLVEKYNDHGDLKYRPIKVRCTDKNYQKIDFDILGGSVLDSAQDLITQSQAYYAQNEPGLKGMIAREMSDAQAQEVLSTPVDSDVSTEAFFTG